MPTYTYDTLEFAIANLIVVITYTCTIMAHAWIQQSTALFADTCMLCMAMNPVKTERTSKKRISKEITNTSSCESENFIAMQYSLEIFHRSGETNVKQ